MRCLGNVCWLLLGGLVLGLSWALTGVLCCITVIGIPFGVQCFKIAGFVLAPFGQEPTGGGGVGSCLLNGLWILLFGWELAVLSVSVGVVYCLTIVGIPLGIQSFKLARLAIWPFGTDVAG
ncbi:MAG TPA: YccF domain-containing protein [Firmicutes bacterium]|nr:YccF domain-containing protein [Bacillota bacterium]